MEKRNNIPMLRFPEFEIGENNSYKKHMFRDIFTFSIGKSIKQNEASPEFDIPCVRYGELYHLYNEVISDVINKTNLDKSELIFSQGDEILLPSAGEDPLDIGSASALIVENVAIGRTINILKPMKADVYSQIYVAYYINQKLRKKISTLAKGVSISNVYNSDLKTLEIILPTLPEQQKIATFFTAINHKISQLKKKKELLEQYKKGVMQKIFSQHIRFKDDDGREFPKWEKKRLGDVYSFRSTNSFSREKLNYIEGVVKNIHYGDIHTKFNTLFDITKEIVPFINAEIPIQSIQQDNYCMVGDLVFADASEDLADVGKCIELVNLNDERVVAGLHTILARPDLTNMAVGFGGYLMKSTDARKQIMKNAQGSKVSSISPTRLSGLNIFVPHLPEQIKIANFLSPIDDKITHTQKQIEKVEMWKKGLMQSMFV